MQNKLVRLHGVGAQIIFQSPPPPTHTRPSSARESPSARLERSCEDSVPMVATSDLNSLLSNPLCVHMRARSVRNLDFTTETRIE
jgi:hypothetical protein